MSGTDEPQPPPTPPKTPRGSVAVEQAALSPERGDAAEPIVPQAARKVDSSGSRRLPPLATDAASSLPPLDTTLETEVQTLIRKTVEGKEKASDGPEKNFTSHEIFATIEEEARRLNARKERSCCMKCLCFTINPRHPFMHRYDLFVLVLVLYSSVMEPYKAAFADVRDETNLLDFFVDLMFYVDMTLTFWTGIDKGYDIVMDKREVLKRYMSGWFVVDLAATVQWALIYKALFPGGATDAPALKLIRIVKVLRLARMGRLIGKLTATWTLHTGFIEAVKFFIYVLIVAHLQACFFYLWPELMNCEHEAEFSWDLVGDGAEAKQCSVEYPEDPGCDEAPMTLGWHWKDTCMQGSWRQVYGLEARCLVGTEEEISEQLIACQHAAELGLQPGKRCLCFLHSPCRPNRWVLLFDRRNRDER